MARKRRQEEPAQTIERRKKNTTHMASKRMHEEPAQKSDRREKDKLAKRNKIQESHHLAARNAQKVLAGEQIVPELMNTGDAIGKLDIECDNCHAIKFKKETASLWWES